MAKKDKETETAIELLQKAVKLIEKKDYGTDPASIIYSKFKKIDEKKGKVEDSIAKSLEKLMVMLADTKKFKKKRLFAISMCMTDKYMRPKLQYYLENIKHTDKFDKKVLQALKDISKAVSSEYHAKQQSKFFSRFRNNSGGSLF